MDLTDVDGQIGFLFADGELPALKDAQVMMEHPFFSMTKNPDMAKRHYSHNGASITVTPGAAGMPTVWDNEILIFCCSYITKAINDGRKPNRVIRTTAHTLLKKTNRSIGKRGYELLQRSLSRLRTVDITTNIETGSEQTRHGFGLINEYKIQVKKGASARMNGIEIELSEWLYRAVIKMEVLTLSGEYFKIKGGIERRLYEICRKHCGEQQQWKISVELLHKKSGSQALLAKFRFNLSKIVEKNNLPDYRLLLQGDMLTVYYDPAGGDIEKIVAIRSVLDGLSDFMEEDKD